VIIYKRPRIKIESIIIFLIFIVVLRLLLSSYAKFLLIHYKFIKSENRQYNVEMKKQI
jgi:hypothetical protein